MTLGENNSCGEFCVFRRPSFAIWRDRIKANRKAHKHCRDIPLFMCDRRKYTRIKQ